MTKSELLKILAQLPDNMEIKICCIGPELVSEFFGIAGIEIGKTALYFFPYDPPRDDEDEEDFIARP